MCSSTLPCTGEDVGKVVLRSVFGTVQIIDLDFENDAVLFAKTSYVLAEALESLKEETEPLGL